MFSRGMATGEGVDSQEATGHAEEHTAEVSMGIREGGGEQVPTEAGDFMA